MTFKPLTESLGADVLTWFLAAFPVRISHALERARESKESDHPCGSTWRESSVKFDRNTRSWKTHRCLWEEVLPSSLVTLPKWGIMRDGALWERTTSPLLTNETESGLLLPTPTCADATMGAILNDNTKMITLKSGKLRKISNQGVSGSIGLARTVAMWPTPAARDCKGANSREHCETNGTGRKHMDQLANAVMYPDLLGSRANAVMTGGATSTECTLENAPALKSTNGTLIPTQFATPQSRDFRTSQQSRWENPERTRNLNDQIGGQLNPTWVEWLMGWPLGWTDCAASATDKFQQWLDSHGKH
jgi:hypothetical protein